MVLYYTVCNAVHAWEFVYDLSAVISSISHVFSVTVSQQCGAWRVMVRYTLEQHVFLYDSYVKYRSAGKCMWKFRHKFHDKRVPSRQTIHNLVNKLRKMGLLIDKKQKHKRQVLTEKLHDTEARLELTPRKSLKHLAQETRVSKSSAKRNVVPVFFNKTINCKKYLCTERTAFSIPPAICEL
jgi:hypothetical protein